MKNAVRLSLDPHKFTKTRIMATVGKKSKDFAVLKGMVNEGATFFRFNGAHIDEEPENNEHLSYREAEEVAINIRRLRSEFRQLIGIYFDLGGPKIRLLHVLGVANQIGGDPKEIWNHPRKDETVIIHAWSGRLEEEFTAKLSEFAVQAGSALDWSKRGSVKEFYRYMTLLHK